jgi:hypothetical protein
MRWIDFNLERRKNKILIKNFLTHTKGVVAGSASAASVVVVRLFSFCMAIII